MPSGGGGLCSAYHATGERAGSSAQRGATHEEVDDMSTRAAHLQRFPRG